MVVAVTAERISGHNAIDPSTGAAVANNTEYGVIVGYRFNTGNWPEWIRPLSLQARAARMNAELDGSSSISKNYRFIVNYEQVLNF